MMNSGFCHILRTVISVIICLTCAVSSYADTLTSQGPSQVRDGFVYQGASAYNYGGDTRVIFGKHTGDRFRWFMYFDFPSGNNSATGPCTLAVYLNSISAAGDTFDLYWNTRQNLVSYVGNNAGTTADSAEMNWNAYFEGGSMSDSSWTSPGGDFTTTDRVASCIVAGGGSAGYRFWVLDSIQVDSLLAGTRTNLGVWMIGRTAGTTYTRCDGYSTDNASNRPWIKFIYTAISDKPFAFTARRREIILGTNNR
jgi:hypothetical protein